MSNDRRNELEEQIRAKQTILKEKEEMWDTIIPPRSKLNQEVRTPDMIRLDEIRAKKDNVKKIINLYKEIDDLKKELAEIDNQQSETQEKGIKIRGEDNEKSLTVQDKNEGLWKRFRRIVLEDKDTPLGQRIKEFLSATRNSITHLNEEELAEYRAANEALVKGTKISPTLRWKNLEMELTNQENELLGNADQNRIYRPGREGQEKEAGIYRIEEDKNSIEPDK